MGLILWIDQNSFATGLLEKVFKQKNLPFYTLASVDDFLYLIEDLKPQLIVLDGPTAKASLELFKKQYASQSLNQLPFVVVDMDEDLNFIGNIIGKIKRPFDPFKIPETLKSFQNINCRL